MVGKHDHHGVDVVASQHVAKVDIRVAALEGAGRHFLGVMLVDLLARRFATQEMLGSGVAVAPSVDIAHRHDLHVVITQDRRQVDPALVAAAN